MGTLEKRHLERLEKLLKDAEKRGEHDTAAAIRWAIYNLEYMYKNL